MPADWPERTADSPGARSPRKTLATVAETLGLRYEERLPLGSWLDALSENRERRSNLPATYVAEETMFWNQFHSKREVSNALAFLIAQHSHQFGANKWGTTHGTASSPRD